MKSEWKEVRLESIVKFLNAKRVPLSSMIRSNRQGKYPYYGASGIVDYLDDYIFDGKYLLISEDGENLNTRKTPIAFIAEGRYWVNNHAHILDEKEIGILEYLKYYFSILNISPYITGAVQPKLNKGSLSAIPITLPPKDIRIKINKILSTLDDKIELNRKMNQTLEEMAQALFKSWFVDFDPVHANAGCKSDAEMEQAATALGISKEVLELFPDAFVESEMGMIPEGWEVKALGDICSIITKGTTPKKSDIQNATDDLIVPFIKVKDISNTGEVNRTTLEKIPNSVHLGAIKRSILKEDDLLFSIAGTIGRVAVVDSDLDNSNTNQAVGIIRLKDKIEHLNLIWLSLQSNRTQKNITSKVVQGVQANTSLTNLRDILVLLPTATVLNRWNDIVGGVMNKLRMNQVESRTLVRTRDTLLPKLLSGELDVSNLEVN